MQSMGFIQGSDRLAYDWLPRALLLLFGAIALYLGGVDQPVFGVSVLMLASFPSARWEPGRDWQQLAGYAIAGWSLFGIMPMLTIGEALGGPYGGSPIVFACTMPVAAWYALSVRRIAIRVPRIDSHR